MKKGILVAFVVSAIGVTSCIKKHKCVCVDNATGAEVFDSGPRATKEEAFASCADDYAEDPDLTCNLWEGTGG